MSEEQGERVESVIRKILQLSIGNSNVLTQPLELTAVGMSLAGRGEKTPPLWKQILVAKFSELIKPASILARRGGRV